MMRKVFLGLVCLMCLAIIGLIFNSCSPAPSASPPSSAPPVASSPASSSASTSAVKPTSQPVSGGTLKVATYVDPVDIGTPWNHNVAVVHWAAKAAIESLFRTDSTGQPAPWLATGYTADPKALTYTITLRKGVKFHDGTDFNAAAMKFNMDKCLAKKAIGTKAGNQ